MTNRNLNFVCWNGPQDYQSSFISALLHVYFPPLFKNIFSSNPLNLRAFFTPTSSKEREGSLLPRVQSKNRIYKIKLFYKNGVYNFLSILFISLDRRKARIKSKFAHKNYCLSSLNIYRYFFFNVLILKNLHIRPEWDNCLSSAKWKINYSTVFAKTIS